MPPGRQAVVSVTGIPSTASEGSGSLELELFDAAKDSIGFQANEIEGGASPSVYGSVLSLSVFSKPDGAPGRHAFKVLIDQADDEFADDVPLEIAVQLIRPGEPVGLVKAAGALATPTPTPKAQATTAPPEDDDGGSATGWLVVIGVGIAGIALGLGAAAVLARRSPV